MEAPFGLLDLRTEGSAVPRTPEKKYSIRFEPKDLSRGSLLPRSCNKAIRSAHLCVLM